MSDANQCDFCSGDGLVCAYWVSGFTIPQSKMAITYAEGGWGACATCMGLVERDALSELVERALRMFQVRERTLAPELLAETSRNLRQLHAQLLKRRTERLALDDPRIVGIRLQVGQPLGVGIHQRGAEVLVEPLYGPGPMPRKEPMP